MQSSDRGFLEALGALAQALSEVASPSMVIGGVAVIARGVPRLTVDIDATVWAASISAETLFEKLQAHGIVGRIPDALAFARERQVLLLRHEASGTPIEVALAWLPFEEEALDRATSVDFGGVKIQAAQPEDLVILKAVAWRDRDRDDVERLLLLHGQQMDLHRVRDLVRQFAAVLEEPERAQQFEQLLQRVGLVHSDPDKK